MCKISFKSATICVHTGLQSATPGTERGANLVHRQFLPLPLKGALERFQTFMCCSVYSDLQDAQYCIIHNVQVQQGGGPIRNRRKMMLTRSNHASHSLLRKKSNTDPRLTKIAPYIGLDLGYKYTNFYPSTCLRC